MTVKSLLLFFCLFISLQFFCAKKTNIITCIVLENSNIILKDFTSEDLPFKTLQIVTLIENRPTPILNFFHAKRAKNKKLIAAALAFPLPFGIVGLHRIYLGSAPYVPVAYIASFGGGVGLLPLIDFCVLLLDKDTKKFVDNKKVFMWVN